METTVNVLLKTMMKRKKKNSTSCKISVALPAVSQSAHIVTPGKHFQPSFQSTWYFLSVQTSEKTESRRFVLVLVFGQRNSTPNARECDDRANTRTQFFLNSDLNCQVVKVSAIAFLAHL